MSVRLVALTDEARLALQGDELVLRGFPFRIGRESRTSKLARAVERRLGQSPPVNDLYIADNGDPLNVSREHVVIEEEGGYFFVTDRGSACGTIVEGKKLGGDRQGGRADLNDHDVIILGTAASAFIFKFRTH